MHHVQPSGSDGRLAVSGVAGSLYLRVAEPSRLCFPAALRRDAAATIQFLRRSVRMRARSSAPDSKVAEPSRLCLPAGLRRDAAATLQRSASEGTSLPSQAALRVAEPSRLGLPAGLRRDAAATLQSSASKVAGPSRLCLSAGLRRDAAATLQSSASVGTNFPSQAALRTAAR